MSDNQLVRTQFLSPRFGKLKVNEAVVIWIRAYAIHLDGAFVKAFSFREGMESNPAALSCSKAEFDRGCDEDSANTTVIWKNPGRTIPRSGSEAINIHNR